ncbi:MAG: methyltransferase [Actinomycetales bacterium]|nr:MAG: methyltransferase [Actinomycetales bacterium]
MPFGPIDVVFDEHVLVPRPWTLAQSAWGTELLGTLPEGRVLELCSGAGQIGLAAVVGTARAIVQVDRSEAACGYARRNAAAAGVEADVRCGSMDEALADGEQFILVVADPPWVPSTDVPGFPEDPVWAIDGGGDGLDVARLCLQVAGTHLAPGGAVLLQVGTSEQVERLASEALAWGLEIAEVRTFERGAVALLRHAEG